MGFDEVGFFVVNNRRRLGVIEFLEHQQQLSQVCAEDALLLLSSSLAASDHMHVCSRRSLNRGFLG
jgi:hypothetical protein